MSSDNHPEYYIKIFDSPRSNILPDTLSARVINLKSVNRSLLDIFRVRNLVFTWRALKDVKFSNVWIEYSGNPISNMLIFCILLFNKNSISLDCHNSAVERTSGKLLRYKLSLLYIKMVQLFFSTHIVVHNHTIKQKLKSAEVFYTPFPKLPPVEKRVEKNDILFLCSLNTDEPMPTVFRLCQELSRQGYRARVTGDPKKISSNEFSEFMFDPYLDYNDYLTELNNSRLAISLTTRQDTLLFAPREAVVLGVRCLVNDSLVNREFYNNQVYYTAITFEEIMQNIMLLLEE